MFLALSFVLALVLLKMLSCFMLINVETTNSYVQN